MASPVPRRPTAERPRPRKKIDWTGGVTFLLGTAIFVDQTWFESVDRPYLLGAALALMGLGGAIPIFERIGSGLGR